MALRRKRRSKVNAPATVLFTSAKNESGEKQLCVYAQCHYSDRVAGPTWGHSRASVDRCLASLREVCDCGRRFHQAREFQGKRVVGHE